MDYLTTIITGQMALLFMLTFAVGFVFGAKYMIRTYRKNPNLHFINAGAEAKANALVEQLRQITTANE